MKYDKLDRVRTVPFIRSIPLDAPIWCTLTPREAQANSDFDPRLWLIRNGDKRRILRSYVRSACRVPYVPTIRADDIADRYSAIVNRYRNRRQHPAYALIVRRLWCLRHGPDYGVCCF